MRDLEKDLEYLGSIEDSHDRLYAIIDVCKEMLMEEYGFTRFEGYWYAYEFFIHMPFFEYVEEYAFRMNYEDSMESAKRKIEGREEEVKKRLWAYYRVRPSVWID